MYISHYSPYLTITSKLKNLYLQDTLTWPADRSYPLMLVIVPQPVPSWEEEFPERARTCQDNLPRIRWR